MKLIHSEQDDQGRWILTVKYFPHVVDMTIKYIGIYFGDGLFKPLKWCTYPDKVILHDCILEDQLNLWKQEVIFEAEKQRRQRR